MSYPLIFGEILFDQFADGSRILGGAPFNVAWHLRGFGLDPKVLSKIGKDALATEILAAAQSWDMDISEIQQDANYATGTVEVSLSNGQPSFDIVSDVAYDHIRQDGVLDRIKTNPPALLYHGSLAIRAAESRDSLYALREIIDAPVFVDINLRPPWWDIAIVEEILTGISWLKINHEELAEVTQQLGISYPDIKSQAASLVDKFHLHSIIVTMGAEGSFIYDNQNYYHAGPARVSHMMDAVGAGDAYSSVVILGIMQGWGIDEILDRASKFAAKICEQRGATCQDKNFYQQLQSSWSK